MINLVSPIASESGLETVVLHPPFAVKPKKPAVHHPGWLLLTQNWLQSGSSCPETSLNHDDFTPPNLCYLLGGRGELTHPFSLLLGLLAMGRGMSGKQLSYLSPPLAILSQGGNC